LDDIVDLWERLVGDKPFKILLPAAGFLTDFNAGRNSLENP